ncbi:fibroblast growth factor-binding protein 2 [Tamandua tetradactyla]|uniref:fibroblast growth factor-binding protein 2 n=1 Tax=Tamandua tetradactyla TaxID=48850 RepID=UPI0040541F67
MRLIPCLLLVALSDLGTLGQAPRQEQGGHGEEFHFQTRGRDSCVMHTSGQGVVQLRVECHNQHRAYWCEYRGQPGVCRSFAANPNPYWSQVLQELRHLDHACQGAPVLRPSVCLKAGPQVHMKQVASSLQGSPAPHQQPEMATRPPLQAMAPAHTSKASQLGQGSVEELEKSKSSTQPTVKTNPPGPRPGRDEAEKMAREFFWEFLQSVFATIISFFQG